MLLCGFSPAGMLGFPLGCLNPWLVQRWVAMRKQRYSDCGPWASMDVSEHEVTQLLLTAGRDFSSPY